MKLGKITGALWFRLAIWFALISFAITISITAGVIFFEERIDRAWFDGLPPELQDEITTLEEHQEEAFAGQEEAFAAMILGLFFGITLTFATIAGAIVARRITAPITDVGRTAQKVIHGDLAARAKTPRRAIKDELNRLVDNFNVLLDTVQSSNERVKADAAAIAHELRTPLAALQMKLHGMLDGVVEVSEAELQRLLAQTQVLSRVVNDLRTLSLASSGDLLVIKRPTDLLQLGQASVDLHSKPLATAGIKATVTGQAVQAEVDPERMHQALGNLIENVIRYAADGGVLDIYVTGDDRTCELRIGDRGPGLELEFRSVVFEPFQRQEASRSREFGGSGLGLSIVKAIAESHGGSVKAQQRDGGGLDVFLTLPAQKL